MWLCFRCCFYVIIYSQVILLQLMGKKKPQQILVNDWNCVYSCWTQWFWIQKSMNFMFPAHQLHFICWNTKQRFVQKSLSCGRAHWDSTTLALQPSLSNVTDVTDSLDHSSSSWFIEAYNGRPAEVAPCLCWLRRRSLISSSPLLQLWPENHNLLLLLFIWGR